jgi:hypothetical protein
MSVRPAKVLKHDYWEDEDKPRASISVLADPEEVRVGVNKTFLAIQDDRLSISGGFPSKLNIQGLSGSMRYAGMLQDSPFPLSLLPSTMATPFPKQIVMPPFLPLLPGIAQIAQVASAFLV